MTTPAVSVLMSVRDGGRHLPETIASLERQRDPGGGIEFVVVDDASTDATPRLLHAWAARDDRVTILTAPAPMGLAAALNHGLVRVRAALVARADADDLYESDRLRRQVAAFRADPTLDVLSCGYVRMGEDGAETGRVVPVTGSDVIAFRTLWTNSLLHPGVMARVDAIRAAGGYDPAYWTAQDSELWARMAASGARLDNLVEPLVRYRVHSGSVMGRRGAAGRALSLTVTERAQRAYLGGLTTDHDVGAVVDLLQSYRPLAPAELRAGLAGIVRIARAARLREGQAVLADLHATAARALWRQARWTGRRNPGLAAALVARSLRWRLDA